MKKSAAISQSLTVLTALTMLASATFVACAKPNDKKNKAPVRAVVKDPATPAKPVPQTKTGTSAESQAADEKLRGMGFEIQALSQKKPSFQGNFELSPRDGGSADQVNPSALAIHCLSSVAEMNERNLQSGLILLGKSSVALTKSQVDSTPETKKLFMIARCDLAQNEKNEEAIMEEFKIKNSVPIKVGATGLMANILIKKDGATEKSVLTNFSCSDKIENSPFNNEAGINLEKGSSVLVVQNAKVDLDLENEKISDETALAAAKLNQDALKLTLIQCK